MKTTLRKVGNSRGVLIPSAFLEAYEIGMEIEMRQEGRRIIIEPVKNPRHGWFNNYQARKDADAWEGIAETPAESEDWWW